MSGFGLVLPLLLVGGGLISLWWLAEPLAVQNSLSAYYHAGFDCMPARGVYRDLLVGLLAAISFCLIIYSGFGKLEDWLLNLAGVFLAGVAFFPTTWPELQALEACKNSDGFQPFEASQLLGLPISIHGASAFLFFVAITAVNFFTAMDTVELIQDQEEKKRWTRIYKVVRWLMPVSVGLVVLLRLVTGTSLMGDKFILVIEWVGIWAFALYWLIKSIEILNTKVDIEIANGNVQWTATPNAENGKKKLKRIR